MSTTQNTTDETDSTDEKAQQIADAMDMTAAELDAKIYRAVAQGAMGDDAAAEQRDTVVESIHDDLVSEVAASVVADGRASLAGESAASSSAGDDPDTYGTGMETPPTAEGDGLDEDDPDNYGTGTEH